MDPVLDQFAIELIAAAADGRPVLGLTHRYRPDPSLPPDVNGRRPCLCGVPERNTKVHRGQPAAPAEPAAVPQRPTQPPPPERPVVRLAPRRGDPALAVVLPFRRPA